MIALPPPRPAQPTDHLREEDLFRPDDLHNLHDLVKRKGKAGAREIIEREYYCKPQTNKLYTIERDAGTAQDRFDGYVTCVLAKSNDPLLTTHARESNKDLYKRLTTDVTYRTIKLQQFEKSILDVYQQPAVSNKLVRRNGRDLLLKGAVRYAKNSVAYPDDHFSDDASVIVRFLNTGEVIDSWFERLIPHIRRITEFQEKQYLVGIFYTIRSADEAEERFIFLKSIGVESTEPLTRRKRNS